MTWEEKADVVMESEGRERESESGEAEIGNGLDF